MSEARSRSSMVEVAANPLTAFTAFTDELDLWWVRGPINAYDSGRLVEMRCEPGVGGRISRCTTPTAERASSWLESPSGSRAGVWPGRAPWTT
jgi:hypothetical protein